MKNYIAIFKNKLEELGTRTGIEVFENPMVIDPSSNFTIEKVFHLPLRSFFESNKNQLESIPSLISVYWGYQLDELEGNGGELNIFNPLNAYFLPVPNDLSHLFSPEEFNKVRILDRHPNTGDGVFVFYSVNDSSKEIELQYMDENGMKYPMALTIWEYFDFSLLTMGFYNWQYLFIKGINRDLKNYIWQHYYVPMQKVLPTAFPELDYSPLWDRMEQFKQKK